MLLKLALLLINFSHYSTADTWAELRGHKSIQSMIDEVDETQVTRDETSIENSVEM